MDTIQNNIPSEMFVADISDIDNNEQIEKPKRRKETTRKNNTEATAWRRRADGTYDHRPLDPYYYRKYVMTPMQCPLCHLMTSRGHIHRHQRSANCATSRNMIFKGTGKYFLNYIIII